MKNSIAIHLYLVAFLCFSACTGQLDLEPAQSISEEQALQNDANVKAVLTGAYDALGAEGLFGGNSQVFAELIGGGDEVIYMGTFPGFREIFLRQIQPSNGFSALLWANGYRAVNICNNVLSALDVVNPEDRATVEGEALFIRALVYFELARWYGKPYVAGAANAQPGVPIVLSPTRAINEQNAVSRNSVEEVYAQVLNDLQKASDLLPPDNGWRAGKWAAIGLLARVHLQMGNYAQARDFAGQIIASNQYSLLPDYATVFNRDDNSSEDIFSIQVTTQDGINVLNSYFSVPEFGGRDGDVEILPAHLALYEAEDARLALFFSGNNAIRSGKWNNHFGNIVLLRLAEMYLIWSESNYRLGDNPAALEAYNVTHIRAGLQPANEVSLEEILLERRRELAHEGFLIHDIKRLKGSVNSVPFDDCALVFPVPERELNANPNLSDPCY